MEYAINTRKVNRSLFAYRVVDIHNDEFGFAQDGVIYTYATDVKAKTKGVTWLRMQKTGETGPDRRKYFLFFADETEASAYVDKHNDIYDMDGNYVASLVRSKFIIFLVLFVAAVIFFTGLAVYLGGSMIMDTTSPFSEDKTIHISDQNDKGDKGSEETDINIFQEDPDTPTPVKPVAPSPMNDAKQDKEPLPDNSLYEAKRAAVDELKRAAELAKKAIDESDVLAPDQKKALKSEIDKELKDALDEVNKAETIKQVEKARDDGIDEFNDTLDKAIAWEFINKYCSDDPGDPYDKSKDPVTRKNASKVAGGENAYNALTDEQREWVNKIILTPTDDEKDYDKGEDTYRNYPEMLADAKKELEKKPSGKFTHEDKGNRIIWPGYNDEFVFYVQNDGEVALNYQISFVEENAKSIPLRFKLKIDDEYALGSATEWVDSATYSGANTLILPGDTVKYTIVWEWQYETSDEGNKYDTKLGVEGLAEYIVHSTVYFEEVI